MIGMELAVYIYDALAQEQWQTATRLGVAAGSCGQDAVGQPMAYGAQSDRSDTESFTNYPKGNHITSSGSDKKLDHSAGQLLHFANTKFNALNQPLTSTPPRTHHSIRRWLLGLWLSLPLGLLLQVTLSLFGWFSLTPSDAKASHTQNNLAPSAFCAPVYLCRTNHVLEAQQLLARKGYYRAPIDGIYGEATWSATVRFQQEYTKSQAPVHLVIDGIAGPQTMAALHGLPPVLESGQTSQTSQNLANPDAPTIAPTQTKPQAKPQTKPNPKPESKPGLKPNPGPPIRVTPPQEEVATTAPPDLAPAAEDDTKPAVVVIPPQRQVRYIQALLQKAGFYDGAVNGIYDATTQEAISQAQKQFGLVHTGEWNQQLATVLDEQVNPRSG